MVAHILRQAVHALVHLPPELARHHLHLRPRPCAARQPQVAQIVCRASLTRHAATLLLETFFLPWNVPSAPRCS